MGPGDGAHDRGYAAAVRGKGQHEGEQRCRGEDGAQ
jgi:hypothetical protein